MHQGSRKALVYGLFITLSGVCVSHGSLARSNQHHHTGYTHAAYRPYAYRPAVIQCVAFAKWDAGIQIPGNARDWWGNAVGVYARGHHWNSRGITRNIEVKDVSEDNDWSAVRVQLAHEGTFGSIYPTHGFIYPRPDQGPIVEAAVHAPMPDLGPAPSDLRKHVRQDRLQVEVAEAPVMARGLDLSLNGIASDAPDRDFR